MSYLHEVITKLELEENVNMFGMLNQAATRVLEKCYVVNVSETRNTGQKLKFTKSSHVIVPILHFNLQNFDI